MLLIANSIDEAREGRLDSEAAGAFVDRVLGELVLQVQFDQCDLTQRELLQIRNALVEYLR